MVRTINSSLIAATCLGVLCIASAQGDSPAQSLLEAMRKGVEQPTVPISPLDSRDDLFEKARTLKANLKAAQTAYLRSNSDLHLTLNTALAQAQTDSLYSDFRYAEQQLAALKDRAQELAAEVAQIINKIDRHRQVGQTYLTTYTSAAPTYLELAQDFRRYAKEEEYRDRRDDYLVFASIFAQLGKQHGSAPAKVSGEVSAVNELYPYLTSTHRMLTRTATALDVLPDETSGESGAEIDEQLRRFVQSFNGFRQQIRTLNERLGAPSPGTAEKSPKQPEDHPGDRLTSIDSSSRARELPSNTKRGTSSISEPQRSVFIDRFAASTNRFESSERPARETPAAWRAAESAPQRNIITFHVPGVTGNDPLRRELHDAAVGAGKVYSIDSSSGASYAVRVQRLMPTLSTSEVRVWLGEVVASQEHSSLTRTAYRP
jgi:uncharacterized protein YfcZ (UPF0381/DUF406 family)